MEKNLESFLVDGFGPKVDTDIHFWCKDHIPNFTSLARRVFELSCSYIHKEREKERERIPKLFLWNKEGLKY